MLPILQVGPLAIQAYSLALLIGATLGLGLSVRLANELGLDGDHIYNGLLYGVVAGFGAARLWHVVSYWPAYAAEPPQIVSLNLNALVAVPGVLVGLLVGMAYFAYHRLPGWVVANTLVPGILVILMGNAAGNLLAGTAFGLPTSLPWALPLWGASRHPTQIYEFVTLGIALGWLWLNRHEQAVTGQLALNGALAYGLIRLFVDATRADSLLLPDGLRVAQVGGLLLALLATAAKLWRR